MRPLPTANGDALRVPGARLYYQVRGTGPVLLILQGGDGDADGSRGLEEQLVDHFTVVTYDRRGLSRSTLDDGADPPSVETHADDAQRLLAALTDEPAFVLGVSIGALIGLDLVARCPDWVRILVAHEPPALELLPEAERAVVARARQEMDERFLRTGAAAPSGQDFAQMGVDFADREPGIVLPQPSPYRAANLVFFRAYDAPAAHRYRLDLAALQQGAATRIVPAGGRTSREFWAHRAAEALAARLGRPFVEFPGGHNGFVLHPKAFAARLRDVLTGAAQTNLD